MSENTGEKKEENEIAHNPQKLNIIELGIILIFFYIL